MSHVHLWFHSDLSEVEGELYKRLQTCHTYLAENLDQTDLLDHLLGERVVTTSDAEAIKAEKGDKKQNCCLLDMLQSKSLTQIERFIKCLMATNQAHLAKELDPNGNEYIQSLFKHQIIFMK